MILIEECRPLGIAPAEEPHVGGGGGGSAGFGQHLEGGFVDVDQFSCQNFILDEVKQGYAGLGGLYGPVAHRGPADFHPEPGKELLLPVQWEMIDKLSGEHMGQQPRANDGLGDDLRRHRCDPHDWPLVLHPFAPPAGIFGADVAQHLDAGRDDIELFAHLFPDPAQFTAAAAGLLLLGQIMDDLYPGQLRRQPLAAWLFAIMRLHRDPGRFDVLRLGQVEQRHLHHGRVRGQFLAPPAEQQLAPMADLLEED